MMRLRSAKAGVASIRRTMRRSRAAIWRSMVAMHSSTLRRTEGAVKCVAWLRLAMTLEDIAAGVRSAIARGAVGFDAVKHLVLCRIERRPARLDMTVYPYLPRAHVATTSARTYLDLLAGTAS